MDKKLLIAATRYAKAKGIEVPSVVCRMALVKFLTDEGFYSYEEEKKSKS
ncbi:MAG: hypothetical protein LBH01_00995 [Verrucomicrobiales bacterium]|jgi:hypothetical protein|nr:hypothetical protein [Verrucomicrobiales bacterium]